MQDLKILHFGAILYACKLNLYKIDNKGSVEEIETLLQPALADDNSSIAARELLAMLYLREQNFDKATSEYEKIASSPEVSDEIKARALDMINLLSEKK